jgi:hypothetical protein
MLLVIRERIFCFKVSVVSCTADADVIPAGSIPGNHTVYVYVLETNIKTAFFIT